MFVRIRLRWKPPAQFAAFHRIRTSTGKRHFCRAALGRLRRLRLPNPVGTENHAILGPSLLAQLYVRGGFLGLLLNQTRGGAGSDGLACHSLFSLDQYLQQCQVSRIIAVIQSASKAVLGFCYVQKPLLLYRLIFKVAHFIDSLSDFFFLCLLSLLSTNYL